MASINWPRFIRISLVAIVAWAVIISGATFIRSIEAQEVEANSLLSSLWMVSFIIVEFLPVWLVIGTLGGVAGALMLSISKQSEAEE